MEFRLPALGEGIESATVTQVLVKPGDAVKAGQGVIAVETDKSTVEVPAESDGVVEAVLVKSGDKLSIGAPLLKMAGGGAAPPSVPAKEQPAPVLATPQAAIDFILPALGEGIDGGTITQVFVKVGDAVKAGQNLVAIETDKSTVEVPADADGVVGAVRVKPGDKVSIGGKLLTITGASAARPVPVVAAPQAATAPPKTPTVDTAGSPKAVVHENGTATKTLIPAGPATRRLARKLGVGLTEVNGSGRGGRVTLDDVMGFVSDERHRVKQGGGAPSGGVIVNAFALPPLPDFAKYGEVEKKPVANIRQTIARNLTVAWRTMPMVTQHDLADVTDLEAARKRTADAAPKGAAKITMTVLAIKACVAALREFPTFNSSYDMNAGELILKKYFHIGIAVDTERGLVVPVIRDADKKSIRDLAAEMTALAEKARAGKLAIDEMRGGCFTITNLGGVGGTSFTPIVNYPEVAILGLSRSSLQPVVRDGGIVPRLMLPLSLTYDHRVVDGADGARFTTRLVQLFSDPLRLLMET